MLHLFSPFETCFEDECQTYFEKFRETTAQVKAKQKLTEEELPLLYVGRSQSFPFLLENHQVAYLKIDAQSSLSKLCAKIQVYEIEDVPVSYPAPSDPLAIDDDYLRTKAGLYPDRLRCLEAEELESGRLQRYRILPGTHRFLLALSLEFADEKKEKKEINAINEINEITLDLSQEMAQTGGDEKGDDLFYLPNLGKLKLSLICEENETKSNEAQVCFDVLPRALPESEILHTEWFHVDCLSDYYDLEPFSEAHFEMIDRFAQALRKMGGNVIYTPILTPSLDLSPESHRSFAQLLRVRRLAKGQYAFNWDLVERYMKMMDELGFRFFEISHLFSQWGASKAVDVYLEKDLSESDLELSFSASSEIKGNREQERANPRPFPYVPRSKERIFGQAFSADDPEYVAFLGQMLAAFLERCEAWGFRDRLIFHISDEPSKDQLAQYQKACDVVAPWLEGERRIDALSDPEFYRLGLVQEPVVALDHEPNFVEKLGQAPAHWIYFCTSQSKGVVNRFMAQPIMRQRSLGLLLYALDGVKGFLHWGLNFYNAQFSLKAIDPHLCPDADGKFPAGDPFLLYPGAEGPQWSRRALTLQEAFGDLRFYEYFSRILGREKLLAHFESKYGCQIDAFFYAKDQAMGQLAFEIEKELYQLAKTRQDKEKIGQAINR